MRAAVALEIEPLQAEHQAVAEGQIIDAGPEFGFDDPGPGGHAPKRIPPWAEIDESFLPRVLGRPAQQEVRGEQEKPALIVPLSSGSRRGSQPGNGPSPASGLTARRSS